MRPRSFRLLRDLAILAAASPFLGTAVAQNVDGAWSQTVSGTYNWSTAGNWLNGTVANGANHTANFTTSGRTGAESITLDTARTLGALVFDDPTGAANWTLSGSNALTLSNTITPSITVNNANITATIACPLAGTQGLSVSGPGTVALASNGNTFSGGVSVGSGTLLLSFGSAIPAGSAVSVSGTGTFSTGGLSSSNPIGTLTVNGGGKFVVPSGSGFYTLTNLSMTGGTIDMTGSVGANLQITGNITTTAGSVPATWIGPQGAGSSALVNVSSSPVTITVGSGTPGGIDLDASLRLGSGGSNTPYVKAGPGTMRITNLANYANFTVQGGTLRVDDASSNGGVGALGTGAVTLNGAFLAYGGPTGTTTTKPITLGANGGGIGILNAGTTWTLNGVISQSAPGSGLNVNGFRVSGTPTTLIFNANNTFTQLVLIQDLATLQVPAIPSELGGTTGTTASPLGQSNNAPGNILLGDGGNGGMVANGRGTLMFAPTTSGSYTTDRGVTTLSQYANNGGGAIGVAAGTTLTMSGQITGQGAFVKTGPGTLSLSNASTTTPNNFAGGLYVENGTMSVAGAVIPAASNVTVASGATFQVAAGNSSAIGTMTLNGGTMSFAGSPTYNVAQIATTSAGGTVNMSGASGATLALTGGISIASGTTTSVWTGAGTSSIVNNNS
jgi:fibronectin-binding autotransporter adhesin